VDVQIHIFLTLEVSDQIHAPAAWPRERAPGTHCIGGWVNTRAGLDDMENWKFLPPPGLELRPLGRSARSQSLYRLSYPGSSILLVVQSIYHGIVGWLVKNESERMGKYVFVTLSEVQSWHLLERTEESDENANWYSTRAHPGYKLEALPLEVTCSVSVIRKCQSASMCLILSRSMMSGSFHGMVLSTVIFWFRSILTFPSGIV
jgi:hypothetical protein